MQVVVFGAHDAPRERLALSYTSRRDPPESGPKQTGPFNAGGLSSNDKRRCGENTSGRFPRHN
jgi:hypothetical protein